MRNREEVIRHEQDDGPLVERVIIDDDGKEVKIVGCGMNETNKTRNV